MWLFLETIIFYAYMLSTTVFILYRQCAGSFLPAQQSDIKKLIQDFLHYAAINLSWFNINFVLCIMPLVVLLYVNPQYQQDYLEHDEEIKGVHLKYLIWAMWVCHMIQFVTKISIYTDKNIPKISHHVATLSTDNDETDDHYKKAFSVNNVDGEEEEKEDADKLIDPPQREAKPLPRYVHFKRTFNEDGVIRWIIFGSVYLILFGVYMFSQSNDVILGLYMPIDFCITGALAFFYFYYRYMTQKEQEKEQMLKEMEQEYQSQQVKASIGAGLANLLTRKKTVKMDENDEDITNYKKKLRLSVVQEKYEK